MTALVIILGILLFCSVLTVIIFTVAIPHAVEHEEVETKVLSNGEVIIKTDEGYYYHAVDIDSVPVLINAEEGQRLWTLEETE
jgi:hypothetical protein